MKRIAITGSSGYIGQRLVAAFRDAGGTVLGIDVRAVNDGVVPDEFCECDIRDPTLIDSVRDFQPDTIIHCAFVIRPLHDAGEMSDINIGGTENVLSIAEQIAPARFLFISSATAYGARPENPVPLPDETQVRPRPEYQYAAEKTALEGRVSALAEKCPEIAVSWVRPAIVGGPGMDNFLSRFMFGLPMLLKLDGFDQPLQFVHECDVVGAIQAVLSADGRGAFNLGPPNWTMTSEVAKETNRRIIPMPFRIAYGAVWLMWKLRFPLYESPPGFLYFGRYPWVVAPDRLCNEIGYRFRYSSTETMKETVKHQTRQRRAAWTSTGPPTVAVATTSNIYSWGSDSLAIDRAVDHAVHARIIRVPQLLRYRSES